ncbi:MAG TPA: RNA polymerase sigma factor [Holophaga sp.]|nr:RNA polymerase sigma factor [Holophaga sp.]HPS67058.1 RNA polymerase sigma factor [Holophaga sp.]
MHNPASEPAGTNLQQVVRRATDGHPEALDQLVRALQGGIYGLALRMLGNRAEAEDATQEILVRVVTRLAQFDGRSQVRTWAYRVAVNYLLDVKKSAVERLHHSFEHMAEDLARDPGPGGLLESESSVLIDEIKVGCTLGMLQCLDRPHRLAFVLGEVLEMPGPEAAGILDIEPALFRKRLQKAREAMVGFLRAHCGLLDDRAPCRCSRMAARLRSAGAVDAATCEFAEAPTSFEETRRIIRQVDEARRVLHLHHIAEPKPSSIDHAKRLLEALGHDHPPGRETWPAAE